MGIKAIISDADGTLVNTLFLIRHGQYEAMMEYLLAKKVPSNQLPKYEEYEHYINKSVGGSTLETFEKTLKLYFERRYPEILKNVDFDEINKNLEPIQDRIAPIYVNPFHGLTELLTWTGVSHTSFGIFTSGSPHHIVRNFGVSLPVLGFTELFKEKSINGEEKLKAFISRAMAVYGMPKLAVITCEDVARTKPDPQGILNLIDQLGVKADEVIVLGDHPYDMAAAIAAGTHAIGVSHGFSTPADLSEAGAVKIVDNLATLPRLIKSHNSGDNLLF